MIDSILLRPLPFPEAGRLVTVFNTYPKAGVERDGSSITNYYERRGRIPAFAAVAIYRYGTAIVGEAGSTEREQIARVSPDFFSTLGAGPAMGRGFTDEETTFQTDEVVILTDAYWRQHFNADPHVIGRQIRVDGLRNTVVGVLPPGFRFLSSEARLYFPFSSRPEDRSSGQRHSGGNAKQMIARLKPGATLAQAQAQIDAQNTTLEADDPQAKMMADAGFRSVVVPLHADHVASDPPRLAVVAGGRVRSVADRRRQPDEFAFDPRQRPREGNRCPAGAGREPAARGQRGDRRDHAADAGRRLARARRRGRRNPPPGVLGADRLPLGSQIAFDARLACVAVLGAVVLGLVLAVPIAWFNLRGSSGQRDPIGDSRRNGEPRRSKPAPWLHRGADCVGIRSVGGAGLLGLSLERAMAVSPGFRPDHVLTGQISLPWNKYPDWPARLAFNERLLKECPASREFRPPGWSTMCP